MNRKEGVDRKLFEFIQAYRKVRGYSPSWIEMRDNMGFSTTSQVTYWLKKLNRDGKVVWDPSVARSVRAKEGAYNDISVPEGDQEGV